MAGNIFLTGLSGSGKTTVAPLLAALRGGSIIDTDELIVEAAGVPIATIFEREGEAGFRTREARAVAQACAQRNAVVALGGGALERAENRELIAASGTLVFLDASLETLERRVRRDATVRPLLGATGALAELRARRIATYATAALTIEVDRLAPHEIAEHIDRAVPQ